MNQAEISDKEGEMKPPFQRLRTEDSGMESPTHQALAVIREQFLGLDADEKRNLHRILRQAQRLDSALADLHLFLPVIEICLWRLLWGQKRA